MEFDLPDICPTCSARAAAARVRILPHGWGGSPVPALAGAFSDLDTLRRAGMARLEPTGWWRPTDTFPPEFLA